MQEIGDVIAARFSEYRETFRNAGAPLMNRAPDEAADYLIRYVLLQPSSVPEEVVIFLDESADLWEVGLLGGASP